MLLLAPRFLTQWQGPYMVLERVCLVNYSWQQLGKCANTQIYLINSFLQLPPSQISTEKDNQTRCNGPPWQSRLKEALTSILLLWINFSLPFLVHTDALDTGLDTICSLAFEREKHLVIYLSRKLSPTKKHYTAM